MTPPESTSRTIRPTAGIVWLVVSAAVVAILLVDVVVRGSWMLLLLLAPWMLWLVWFVLVFRFLPRVVVDLDGVVVANPFRTTTIPWSAVEAITLRWQVAFQLGGERVVNAWAIAPGRRRGKGPSPAEREAEILGEFRSRAETEQVVSRWGTASVTRWNPLPLATAALLVTWTVLSILIARG